MAGTGCDLIILAGGAASRMGAICADAPAGLPPGLPKALLPVMGRPFILWQIEAILRGCPNLSRVHCVIRNRDAPLFESLRPALPIPLLLSIETTPMGTGGAILCAAARPGMSSPFLVMNGDVLFNAMPQELLSMAHRYGAAMQGIEVADISRFGVVDIVQDRIKTFIPQSDMTGAGLINAGLYAFMPQTLHDFPVTACSFERAIAPRLAAENRLGMVRATGTFMDIGTPESYAASDRFMIENGFAVEANGCRQLEAI